MIKTRSENIHDALVDVRKLIDIPDRWAQRAMAYDEHGNSCPSYSNEAVCFCLIGAIERVTNKHNIDWIHVANAVQDAITDSGYSDRTVIDFNDDSGRTHKEIMGVLNRAIRRYDNKTWLKGK